MLELTRNVAERARTTLGVTAQNLALQDAVAVAFHAYLLVRVSLAPDSPDATVARRMALALLVITSCSLVLSRGEVIRSRSARALTYRLGLFLPMVLSYFEMRTLLPALQPDLMDNRLYAIDLWLLGTTPSIWMQAWNVEPIVEWLSLFYYSHFFLLVVMLVPALFFGKGTRLQELMAGGMLVVAAGHFLYTIVPGVGPYATIAFDEPLHGGFWWKQVEITVATAGAQLDIFPSLHTAWPAYFSLHCFAHRDAQPFRWLWPVIAFVALNIIVATMFLRWHWFIDVAIGLLLAFAARAFAKALTARESHRGGPYDARQPVWERI
ncbi:MAG: phosphatase PAP2 family protein [Polyangiales bacterium]